MKREKTWKIDLDNNGRKLEVILEMTIFNLIYKFKDYLLLYKYMTPKIAFIRFIEIFLYFDRFNYNGELAYFINIFELLSIYYIIKPINSEIDFEKITVENRHDEIDFGRPVGNEIW